MSLNSRVVFAAHPDTQQVINPARHNNDYRTLCLRQESFSITGGFGNKRTKVAFLTMSNKDMEDFKNYFGESKFIDGGEFPIPGKLQVVESFEPFYDGQAPKINPTDNSEVLVAGKNVYRQCLFTEDENAKDILISEAVAVKNSQVSALPAGVAEGFMKA